MVTVRFKLADTDQIQLTTNNPESLEAILKRCNESLEEPLGSVIVIRDGKVVPGQNLVEPGDILDVYPAISGG